MPKPIVHTTNYDACSCTNIISFQFEGLQWEEVNLDMIEAFGATLKRKNHLILVLISPSS